MMLGDNVRSLLRRVWNAIAPDNPATGMRALLRFLQPYRWQAVGLVVFAILSSVFEAVGVSLIIPVLQSFSSQANEAAKVTDNFFVDLLSYPFVGFPPERRLQVIVAVIVVLIVLKNIVVYVLGLFTSWLRIHLERDLCLAVFDQLMRVSYRFITDRSVGDLLNHLAKETARAGVALQGMIQILAGFLLVVAYAILLLLISWPLTVVAVSFLLFLTWILRWPAHAARALGKEVTESSRRLSQVSVESLAAMRLIRAFGREPLERERYRARVIEMNTLQLRSARVTHLTTPLAEILSVIFLAAFLLLATPMIINQSNLLVPVLLTFLFVLYRLLPRVASLNAIRVNLALFMAGADAVARMLDPRDKPYIVSGVRPFQGIRSAIRFEHVTFAYKLENGPVLRDICLEIPFGCTTAIVGVSGVGKSTLADLVLRFYDPESGHITVDGVDLHDLNLIQWRAAIGVVSQDTFVFNSSVRENIAYGRLGATEDEITHAARLANAHEFIIAMPEGYETVIGERGVRLSTGQRQRIAIARAVLRNPQILILDEATSALDSDSEWHVQQALYKLSAHRTVLVIAHRLSTLAHADQIAVLEEGKVVECGKHAELLAQRGCYYTFWHRQSAGHEMLESRVPPEALP